MLEGAATSPTKVFHLQNSWPQDVAVANSIADSQRGEGKFVLVSSLSMATAPPLRSQQQFN